jgi:hypothetical protein
VRLLQVRVQVLLLLRRGHLLPPRPLLRVVLLLLPVWLAPPLSGVVLAQQLLLVGLVLARTQTGWGRLLLLLLLVVVVVGLALAHIQTGRGRLLLLLVVVDLALAHIQTDRRPLLLLLVLVLACRHIGWGRTLRAGRWQGLCC